MGLFFIFIVVIVIIVVVLKVTSSRKAQQKNNTITKVPTPNSDIKNLQISENQAPIHTSEAKTATQGPTPNSDTKTVSISMNKTPTQTYETKSHPNTKRAAYAISLLLVILSFFIPWYTYGSGFWGYNDFYPLWYYEEKIAQRWYWITLSSNPKHFINVSEYYTPNIFNEDAAILTICFTILSIILVIFVIDLLRKTLSSKSIKSDRGLIVGLAFLIILYFIGLIATNAYVGDGVSISAGIFPIIFALVVMTLTSLLVKNKQ